MLGVGVVRASLLAYGLLIGCVAFVHYDTAVPDRGTMMSMRSDGVSGSIRVLDAGGPPLAVSGCAPYDYCELPANDAPGIYLYLPVLGHILHVQSPELLLKWLFIGLMVPVVALYPLLMFRLLGSVAAALAAPVLILLHFSFLRDSEIYWIQTWAVLLGVPLLTLAWSYAKPAMMLMLAAVMLAASLASSIRALAGLPLLITAIGIVLLRERSWTRRGVFVGLLLAAYLVIAPGLFVVVAAARDRAIDGEVMPEPKSNPWHQIYLGLGYLDNPYGIRYDDGVAYTAVLAVDPAIKYLGPGYGDTLRGLVFRIVSGDPRFVVDTVVSKVAVAIWTAMDSFGLMLLMVPFMLRWGGRSPATRTSLVIAAPALVWGLVPPVLVMPFVRYQMTWLGAWGFIAVLAVAWAVGALPRWLESTARAPRGVEWHSRPRTVVRSQFALVVAVLISLGTLTFAALSNSAANTQDRALYRESEEPIAALGEPGSTVETWNMRSAVTLGWRTLGGVSAEPLGDDLRVVTNLGRLDYQLVGPALSLDAGRYRLAVEGRVVGGGADVGVLNVAADSWISQGLFWYGQFERASPLMTVDFTLEQRTDVRVILANWHWRAARSDWLIRNVSVERLETQ